MTFIFFTNIVAPYRVILFNELEELRKDTDFDFEVFFMRKTESNRQWEINLSDLNFKYRIGNGFYSNFRDMFLHFNPILIYRLIRSGNEIILGASWNNFNTMLLVLLKKSGLLKNRLSVWSEANYLTLTSQKKNKFRDKLRKWFFSGINGSFILPGKMSLISFAKWNIDVKSQQVILLPNLVSQFLFQKKNNTVFNADNNKPVLLIIARLEEKLKGILNFMEAIGFENLRKINLRIAGIGNSYENYNQFVVRNKLSDTVFFLGNLTQSEISNEYNKADVFVLPSFSDPSPLTVIEATSSGLPLLISDRCGNHYEALDSGFNGYSFNPFDPEDIKNKFELLMSNRNNWGAFSENSLQIAKTNFNNEKIIRNLIFSLIRNAST